MSPEAQDDGLLVTGFTLGQAAFAVDARRVMEVVKPGEFTRVHGAPRGVLGIRNLRGRIITLVDMATHLGLGSVLAGTENRLLIMEHRGDSYGFLVDAVGDAMALDSEHIDPPPANLDPNLIKRLQGVWHDGDRLFAILETESLFQWDDTISAGGLG